MAAAGRLDLRLRQVVRGYNASKDVIAVNDATHLSFILGRVHGVEDQTLLQWIDEGPSALSMLEERYQAATTDPTVQHLLPHYREAQAGLEKALQGLRTALQQREP